MCRTVADIRNVKRVLNNIRNILCLVSTQYDNIVFHCSFCEFPGGSKILLWEGKSKIRIRIFFSKSRFPDEILTQSRNHGTLLSPLF